MFLNSCLLAVFRTFRFSYFNPVQTQVFHTALHTDESILLGAPTGVFILLVK
jgi:Lhr-like helicase